MAAAVWFPLFLENALKGGAPHIVSNDIRAALVAGTYTPADTHDFWNDVVANELATGGGYTANGLALASKAWAYVAANSWSVTWSASASIKAGTIIRPTTGNGRIYRAQNTGTGGGTEPTWPTVYGDEVADGGVTWTCIGRGALAYTFTDPAWTGFTGDFRYVVFYDRTPASDATRPVIGYVDMGAQSLVGANLTIDGAGSGVLIIPLI